MCAITAESCHISAAVNLFDHFGSGIGETNDHDKIHTNSEKQVSFATVAVAISMI